MARQARRSPAGCGSIRKRIRTINGKVYTSWEARYTIGVDPATGKQIQKSISGKTQKEVARRLREILFAMDSGLYAAPSHMTVSQWMDIWQTKYLGRIKHSTKASYKAIIKNHIKPKLGAAMMVSLTTHQIQLFYNHLNSPTDGSKPLAPKTIRNIHVVLHKALQQAVLNNILCINPCDSCVLPKIMRKEIFPLEEAQITLFLRAIKGHRFESLFITNMFTGLREGEVCGLLWDCVDLENGTMRVNKQLQKLRQTKGKYCLLPTKNNKGRLITLPPFVVSALEQVKNQQTENQSKHGGLYIESGFVFTDSLGHHLSPQAVYRDFKKVATDIGCPNARFHDLRHTYAVAAIGAGDDIKTLQENLGHATTAFTLDVYGHLTQKMKQESADRMEQFIRQVTP